MQSNLQLSFYIILTFSLTVSSSCQSVAESDIAKTAGVLQFGAVEQLGLLKRLGSCQVWKVPSSHFPPCCELRLVQMSLSPVAQAKRTGMWPFQGMIKYFSIPQWLAAALASDRNLDDPVRAAQPITMRQTACLPFPLYSLGFHYTLAPTYKYSSLICIYSSHTCIYTLVSVCIN